MEQRDAFWELWRTPGGETEAGCNRDTPGLEGALSRRLSLLLSCKQNPLSLQAKAKAAKSPAGANRRGCRCPHTPAEALARDV